MKRILIILLSLSIILSLGACRFKKTDEHETGKKEAAANEDMNEIVVEPQNKPSMGFSFSLPKKWIYELERNEEDTQVRILVRLRPDAPGIQGDITIGYEKWFGVCGTGLISEQIDFNGYEATKGTYEGSKLWSFIVLKGDFNDCVIINGARDWYDDYADEIELILESVRFKFYE